VRLGAAPTTAIRVETAGDGVLVLARSWMWTLGDSVWRSIFETGGVI
jgi:hypothetical protein